MTGCKGCSFHQDRIKGDHRILGDSAFVMEVLAEAEERSERFYELKSKGYDLNTIEQKFCEVFGIEPDEIYSKSRQKSERKQGGYFVTGGRGLGIFIGGFGKTFWYDRLRDRVCCAKG